MDMQHILKEIKRTAKANGGPPLGHRRFFRETGIKESDWSGRYWARWGDAVREAGFEPNELQAAYGDDSLIEKLISLVRDLGHFPVRNELRLRAREDPEFPNEKTFAQLGGGLGYQLALAVKEYCVNRKGYDDVLALCSKMAARLPDSKPNEHETEDGTFGFVYLMRSGRYCKIGRSKSVGRREYELGIQLPAKLKTIHRIKTDDPVGIEEYWHKRFEAKRKNGEWFELSSSDVNAFTRRTFM